MRTGGGQAKGASFEREIAVQLSIWLTRGVNSRVFGRNVLSGGSFTAARARGTKVIESGISGDIAGIRAEAHAFLNLFSVEIKHYADLGLVPFLSDFRGTSFLSKTIALTKRQAAEANKSWIVIARQNRMKTLMFMEYDIALRAKSACRADLLVLHSFFDNKIAMTWFDNFTTFVQAEKFLSLVGIASDETTVRVQHRRIKQ